MSRGIWMMIAATFVFGVQDGLSRHLAEAYSVYLIVMIRYWFFAVFVVVLALRQTGGLRSAIATKVPGLQILRGLLLAAEVCVMVTGFVVLGLVESHAIFASYPLLITAMAWPMLKERPGWRRISAVAIGFVGVLVVLRPGFGVVSLGAVFPLTAATMFAVYGVLTRMVSRHDSSTVSLFWTGTAGAVAMTCVGIWFWEPISPGNWIWMGLLCVTGVLGHWFLIIAYDLSEVSEVQPFAYFQLVFGAGIGVLVFREALEWPVVLGAAIIVSAGIFTIRRQRT